MNEKSYARVIYDRKKRVVTTGSGDVEIYIYISPVCKRYIKVSNVTPIEFHQMKSKNSFDAELHRCNSVARAMVELGEELSTENLDFRLGITKRKPLENYAEKSFIDFMNDEMLKERLRESTRKHEYSTLNSLITYGKMIKFKDFTPRALKLYDEWLAQRGAVRETTRRNYHKHLNKFLKKAYEQGLISENPYMRCHFKRGVCRERRPLSEEELIRIRDFKFHGPLEKAADLFIFSCYTGLSYCDNQLFDFRTMTQKKEDRIYIDGSRLKTGNHFYTPILPPAMEILEKYDYQLPRESNQKLNMYLKMIQECCNINKDMTFHLARHTFATLLLSYGSTVENLAKMLGHKDIKTTQIYAKILNKNVEDQINLIADRMK